MFFKIILLFVLILLNGLFAMAEIALIAARRTWLEAEARGGHRGAQVALKLLDDPGRFLSTVSVAITLIAVSVSTVGGDSFVEPLMVPLSGVDWLAPYAHTVALGIVVVVISFLSLVLGELVPKRIAVAHPETLAKSVAIPIAWFSRFAHPAERVLSFASSLVLALLPKRTGGVEPVTDEEVTLLMRSGVASGAFAPQETAIVHMALRLDDRRVDAIMTPRTQVEWLDLEDSWDEIRERLKLLNFSRYPVVEGGPENVVGILQVKDLVAKELTGAVDIRKVMRPPTYVPNTVAALKLLETLKKSGEPMAIVVDEYGSFDGIITLQDILEALVGDIADPEDAEQALVRREDGSWLIDGLTPLDEVKEAIGVHHLPDEDSGDFHTLGGFVMARMKRVPRVADHFEAAGWRFEVVDMDGHRVDRVMAAPIG
jgi:putative hemolysin